MSTDLVIHTSRTFDPRALPFPDLRWTEAEDGFLLHRTGLSTRSTPVSVAPERIRVEIRALASDADIDLAVAIAESFGAPVEVEGHHVATDALAAWFDAGTRAGLADSGAHTLKAMVEQGRGPMTAPGPVRAFVFGERLLAELDGPGFPVRLIERMRSVQWDVPDRYRDAGVFLTGEAPSVTRLAIWIGAEDLVLPNVQYLVLTREGSAERRIIPAEHAPALAGPHARRLDERQLLVDRFDAGEWADLTEQARAFSVDRIP